MRNISENSLMDYHLQHIPHPDEMLRVMDVVVSY